jgi:hypothetical protein
LVRSSVASHTIGKSKLDVGMLPPASPDGSQHISQPGRSSSAES